MVIWVIKHITGSLGTQNVKVLNLHFGQERAELSQHFGTRSWISRKSLQYARLVASKQTVRSLTPSNDQSAEIQCKFFIL